MPMVDAYIPEGALSPEKEAHLIKDVTNLLIKAEGFDPATNRVAQGVSVVFLHRPTALYVAGTRATEPRYRIVPSVPEGKYSDEAVQQLIREITEAFARAEGTKFEDIAPRVWVFPTEIPEGRWGARGVVRSIVEIQDMLGRAEPERDISKLGNELLAKRRRAKALEVVEGIAEAVRRDVNRD